MTTSDHQAKQIDLLLQAAMVADITGDPEGAMAVLLASDVFDPKAAES